MKRKLDNEVINSNKKPRHINNTCDFDIQKQADRNTQAIKDAFYNPGIMTFEKLAQSLKAPITMIDCESLLRNVTIYLNKNRNISLNMTPGLTSLVAFAFQNLGNLLDDASNPGSEFATWKNSLAPDSQSQAIAFLIYNCAQIAETRLDVPQLSAATMEILLKSIRLAKIQTSKSISNSLYSIGLLTEADKIRGTIKAASVQDIFNEYLYITNPGPRNISNSLYGLGLMAKAGKLHGDIDASPLQNILNNFLSLKNINNQDISNILCGLGWLAKAGKLQGNIEISSVQDMFKKLLSQTDLNTQTISNCLYSFGCLAEAGKLKGNMTASFAQDLFKKLLSLPNLQPQNISNSLYGLGLLAEADKLSGDIEAAYIQKIFKTLMFLPNLNSQAISNSLYGLGFLAQAIKLKGNIEASCIEDMFKKLLALPNLKALHISNSLYSNGLLAQADKLKGDITSSHIQDMLHRLLSIKPLSTQFISNALYGIGSLAKMGKLRGNIEILSVQDMFRQLLSLPNLEAQHISNSLYGLGLLAKADNLHGSFETPIIMQDMMKKLLFLPDTKAQQINNSLQGLGFLAQAGKLHGSIKASFAQTMCTKLLSLPDMTARAICNSLYSLGLLAKAGNLKGHIEASFIQTIFKTLLSLSNLNAQDVSTTLYSLGFLAGAGNLQGNIETSSIDKMFKKLLSLPYLNNQDISNSLYGFSLLAEADKVWGTIDSSPLQLLLKRLMVQNPQAKEAGLTLGSLSRLIPLLPERLAINAMIKKLIRIVLNVPYLHPTMAASILNNLIILKDSIDTDATDLFRETIEALGIRLERFPRSLQRQLEANIQDLATRPQWQSMLQKQLGLKPSPVDAMEPEIPEPVGMLHATSAQPSCITKNPTATPARRAPQAHGNSTHFTKACDNNKIFQAIATKNAKELRVILNILKELSVIASATISASGGRYILPGHPFAASKPRNAEQLVIDFLYLTNATALRELVSQSPAQYFILLLQACSEHKRFELAHNNILHPIIINLSPNELPQMIDKLISPFQIYRDHQALLHVIDALTIRAEKKPQEQQAINKLQANLLAKALDFHLQCKHHHVVNRLQGTQTRLKNNELLLLDMNNNADTSTEERMLAVISKPAPAPPTGMVINSKYQYETEDIQAILAIRTKSYSHVSVMAAAQINQNIEGNSVADVLAPYISTLHPDENQGRALLVPIHIPGHWVGLLVSMRGKNITGLTYFNSSKNETCDNQRMTLIKNQLCQRGLIDKELNIKPTERAMQQCDATSCGALLIENFYCFLKGMWHGKTNILTQQDTQLIRQRHIEVLRDAGVDYYTTFYNRQAQNRISVPDLETQQKSHGISNNSNGLFKPVTKPQPANITDHSSRERNDGRQVRRS